MQANSPDATRNLSLWLDAFRWVAAFSVLVSHAGSRLLEKAQSVPGKASLPHYLYQFLAGFSHPGVMVFFVLSGYLVGGSVLKEFRKTGDIDLQQYFIKRIVRLSIVLWPALLLTALFDHLGAEVFGAAEMYQAGDKTDLMTGVCNALYMNTLTCQHYGSNVVLWSLSNEFMYYLLFPAILLALYSKRPMLVRILLGAGPILCSIIFALFQFDMVSPMLPYFSIWLLGVWVSTARRPIIKSIVLSAALFAAYLVCIRIGVRHDDQASNPVLRFGIDLILALVFCNLLIAMRVSSKLKAPPLHKLHAVIAGFSYSLYCLHVPVLHLYIAGLGAAGINAWHMAPRNAEHWAILFGGLAVSIVVAALFARATESQTNLVKDWFLDGLSLKRDAAA